VIDLLRTQPYESLNLILRVFRREVHVHSTFCGLGLGHPPEQDPSDSTLVGAARAAKSLSAVTDGYPVTSDQKLESLRGSAQSKVTYLMNAVMARIYRRRCVRCLGLAGRPLDQTQSTIAPLPAVCDTLGSQSPLRAGVAAGSAGRDDVVKRTLQFKYGACLPVLDHTGLPAWSSRLAVGAPHDATSIARSG